MAGLDLENRPWYVALIIGVLIAGGLVWASEKFVFKDIRADIVARTKQLEDLREKVRQGQSVAKNREAFKQRVEQLETEWSRLLRILPTAKQTDELIKKLKALTERGNFRFVRFQPGGFTKKDFYSEWPITVQLDGTYHELALFFDRLARFSRIINVDSARINALGRRGQANPYTINTTFTMKTFIYGDASKAGVK
jgi:type IV pilus assembly protein PilO